MSAWLASVTSGLIAKPEPTPRSAVRHIEMLGHVSNTYRRTRRAECGSYFAGHDFAGHADDVTCPACRAVLDARENTEV